VPAPKWVIAMGDCTIDGGEFGCNYATVGAVERIIPVDLVIPGCPPTPAVLMQALLALLQQ